MTGAFMVIEKVLSVVICISQYGAQINLESWPKVLWTLDKVPTGDA